MKYPWKVTATVLALCLALVGCGGSKVDSATTGSEPETTTETSTTENPELSIPTDIEIDPAQAFIGEWEVVRLIDDDESESMDEDVFDQMRAAGMNITLTLNADGTAILSSGDDAMEGTWSATDTTSGTISLEGGRATLEFEGDELVLTEQTDVIYFRPYSSGGSSSSEGTEYFGGNTIDDLTNPVTMSVDLVDDDVCTIKVVAMGEYAGDPGFLFELTNKCDVDVLFVSVGDWEANGETCEPILYETLRAGETLESIMWFDAVQFGTTDPSELQNISGMVAVVESANTDEILGVYEIAL